MEWFSDHFVAVQGWLFEAVVPPRVYAVGLGGWTGDAFSAAGWLLVGLIQVVLRVAVLGPLQRWRPVEPAVDRRAIRTDILCTLIQRLGLLRLAMFFALRPLFEDALGSVHAAGWGTLNLDSLWPASPTCRGSRSWFAWWCWISSNT